MALAQVTAISQAAVRTDPPGTTPPFIITSTTASSVPILQLALSGKKSLEQQLNDLGANFIPFRNWQPLQGAVLPNPYGGKQRQGSSGPRYRGFSRRKVLSPNDVVSAIRFPEPDFCLQGR